MRGLFLLAEFVRYFFTWVAYSSAFCFLRMLSALSVDSVADI
jgi:hypothetical protein